MESPNTDEEHIIGDEVYNGDDFRGTIIKDYWRLYDSLPIPGYNCETPTPSGLSTDGKSNYFTNACKPVNTVIDYGYQQIQKHGYIAANGGNKAKLGVKMVLDQERFGRFNA